MAFTQNEKSFSNDSSYYTYNKSTDRISGTFQHPFEINNNIEYGVNSTIREDDAGLNIGSQ